MSVHIRIEGLDPPHHQSWFSFIERQTLDTLAAEAATRGVSKTWRLVDYVGIGFVIDRNTAPGDLLALARWCTAPGNEDPRVRAACAKLTREAGDLNASALASVRSGLIATIGATFVLGRHLSTSDGGFDPDIRYFESEVVEHPAPTGIRLFEVDGLHCFFTT